MLGAIALFLFGMSIMTDGLAQLSSGRLESILERLTDNVFKGIVLGAFVTALIHSSATTTVMCVGFVNAGVMKLEQTVGIIMGANIGTTVTAQILRLASISGENPILAMLQPSILGPVMAVIGIVFYMFLSRKNIGQIFLGTGILFIGMNTMTTAVMPLQNEPWLADLFTAFSNPILGMAVGALITALLQSSTAFTGILQALSTTGAIHFNTAIPLIMGQNIGTTLTALLSSTGANKNAKRTALIHFFFNVVGSVFFLFILYAGNAIFRFSFWNGTMDMGSVANFHLVFNLTCTALFLPFRKQLVMLVEKLVPGEAQQQDDDAVLDERFLSSPSIALERAHEAVILMGDYALENYRLAVEMLRDYDDRKLERLNQTETALDHMENALDNYLVLLTNRALSPAESSHVSELLHTLSNFERIGDYAVNIAECAAALNEKGLSFSAIADQELDAITGAVDEALENALTCYRDRSFEEALQVEPLEEVVDLLRDELKDRHIERLKKGECTIELGSQFLELLINLERISDHCSNVALTILRQTAPLGDLVRTDTHAYTHELHHAKNQAFEDMFAANRAKYYEPLREAWEKEENTPPEA
ncbi:MAG: Na/Pi cotransporter family protein [Oscillospiraceae bacterium]|nr:Na/Pi cotransporter family protein [Oscillospiraceae bacterium]